MVEHQKILQFQIERERIRLQIYVLQPLVMVALYGFVMYLIFTGSLLLGGSSLVGLSILTGVYYHFNFVQSFNTLYFKIECDTLHIEEKFFQNKKIELSKVDYLYIETNQWFRIVFRKRLKCYYKEEEITIINMYHFLLGVIPNTNLQEFLFYLHNIHPTIEIHSSANFLD